MAERGYILAESWPQIEGNISVDQAVASTDFVIENLINKQPGKRWRSADTTVQTISGTFSKFRVINSIALWNHNFSEDALITVEIYSNADLLYTTTVSSLGPVFGWGEQPWDVGPWGGYESDVTTSTYRVVDFDQEYLANNWKVIIDDTANPDGYIQMGTLLLGDSWKPEFNFAWGAQIGWFDPTELEEYEDGSIGAVDDLLPYRIGTLTWEFLNEALITEFNEITRRVGKRNVVLINPYPGEATSFANESRILARLTDWQQPIKHPGGRLSVSVNFREAL